MSKPAKSLQNGRRRPVYGWSSFFNIYKSQFVTNAKPKKKQLKPKRSKTFSITGEKDSTGTYKLEIIIRPRALLTYFIVLVGLVGILMFGFQLGSTSAIKTPKTFSIPAPKTDYSKPFQLESSLPINLNIDKINLDVPIVQVGRQADGSIQTPNVLDYVTAWYKYSPTPGEVGPSVIVGHVDSYKGISVFWRLRELTAGDLVEIKRADGTVANFKVTGLQQFDQANFPTEAVYGNIPYAGLRLITCGGTFNKSTGHYDQNTVVFAQLVKG